MGQIVLALVDFSASLPFLVLALAALAFLGNSPSLSIGLLVGLLGLHAREGYARIARGLAHDGRHVLPNVASTLIVSMTLASPEIILPERGLSVLGLGVQSLGSMVGHGREYLTRAPWMPLSPAAVIVLTTFAVSMLGGWLRNRLGPTLRQHPPGVGGSEPEADLWGSDFVGTPRDPGLRGAPGNAGNPGPGAAI